MSHPIAAIGVERDLARQPPFPSVALCAVCDSSSIRGSLPQGVWGGERNCIDNIDMGFPSGRYLPSASLPLRAALRGRGLVFTKS